MQENKLQETIGPQDQVPQFPVNNQATLQSRFSVQALSETAGTIVCCDAAWKMDLNKQPTQAGIGVYIKLENNQHCKHIYIAALSPPATSPLQAEAFAFAFGTKIADGLRLQQPQFFTDCKVLATALASEDILAAPSPWTMRPHLAEIQASSSFAANRVHHFNRSLNIKAHHQARLALKFQNRNCLTRCINTGVVNCPAREISSVIDVNPFTVISVLC